MAEELIISTSESKAEKYKTLIPQLEALTTGERDLVANLANIAAALKQTMDFFWVGFYLVKDEQLVLGPFQGPIACTRINRGKGVCGTSWAEKRVLVVPNVDEFPGHIACASSTRSEIVVPVFDGAGKLIAVLDIDSDLPAAFNEDDAGTLEAIVEAVFARPLS